MYSPKVAVVDSGVDTQNQEIMEHVIQGFSFQKSAEENGIVEEENFDDVFGHGTNCIDCILQFAEQAQFYPIKIVNELGKTTSSLLLAALKKCRELQVDLICLSLSVTQILDPAMEKELRDICNDLEKQGKIQRPVVPEGCVHNAHMYYIKVKDIAVRTRLIAYLRENGIAPAFHYVPLHSSPAGEKFGRFHGKDVYTTKESERLLRLPMFYDLSMDDVDYIAEKIREFEF